MDQAAASAVIEPEDLLDEKMNGFLELMSEMETAGDAASAAAESADECMGFNYSRLVRKELQLTIKLRRLQRGETEDLPASAAQSEVGSESIEVSTETRKMQQQRRERNRQSAKQCRRRRRDKEKVMRSALLQLQQENSQLRQRAKKFERLYRESLSSLPTKTDFQTYLKKHHQLVRDADVKPVLRAFLIEDYPKMPNFVMMALVPADSVQRV